MYVRLTWEVKTLTKVTKLSLALLVTTLCFSNLTSQSSDWYIGHTLGTDWMDVLKQAGFNRDTVCYPTFMCPEEPEGYRWFYDLDTHTGYGMELSIGKSINEFRAEVAVALASNDIRQIYDSLTFLDGTPVELDENSEYSNAVESRIGSISFSGLMLNAYRDFPMKNSIPLTTYIGFGVGASRVQIEELVFRSDFACISEPCNDPQVARFNVLQNADIEDWVWAVNLSAGIDYQISRRVLVGLKLAHRKTDDLVQSASYLQHPIPDAKNTTRVSELSSWSLSLSLKLKR